MSDIYIQDYLEIPAELTELPIVIGFVPFSGIYDDLTNKPDLTVFYAFDGSYNNLLDLPSLFSGSYTDLIDKPTLLGKEVDQEALCKNH